MDIRVYDINWDTTDFTEEEELASGVCVPDLPKEVTIIVDEDDWEDCDPDDFLANELSNEYGFCVNGFFYEVLDDNEDDEDEKE